MSHESLDVADSPDPSDPLWSCPKGLPELAPEAVRHARIVRDRLRRLIAEQQGWISFETFMNHVLYDPLAGYYSAGLAKLGAPADGADFITAPELTPVFAHTLARQVAEVLQQLQADPKAPRPALLEMGAGTGRLAEALLDALAIHGLDEVPLYILELSPELRDRQRRRLGRLAPRVCWLDHLPDRFRGVLVANEVLDAMPIEVVGFDPQGVPVQWGVSPVDEAPGLQWRARAAPEDLAELIRLRVPPIPGYRTELNLRAESFLQGLGEWFEAGAAFFFDYGFPQTEYYHPQRSTGTVMCHVRHVAHTEPLVLTGIQDITAHVDFSAMAEAAQSGGLELLGYTSQARFLINAGLMQVLSAFDPAEPDYAQKIGPVQRLLSEAEMGELFKVLAVGKGLQTPLSGFAERSRSLTRRI